MYISMHFATIPEILGQSKRHLVFTAGQLSRPGVTYAQVKTRDVAKC